ncbi:hypothetical protein Pth03_29980 [Planotetraspora thailandica]|uniref:RCK N-terminal domain-containing protein n=1 Tax=Planotetraspora thailandica TaxID=487172 RepID=A0A8J3UYV1_9ACTN|nr:NAD-binding protein [Planotetraspora thailandica]GII54609.1 hypothetical protein Pth03_29980 [Planotetraspora thailandica]
MPFSATSVVRATFITLGLLALVTGYFGLSDYWGNRSPITPLDLFYWDLQLFVIDSGALGDPEKLPAMLEFARFAAPGVTVYTLVEGARLLLASELLRIRARESRDHVVVCGSGAVAIALVEKLRRSNERIVMISQTPTTPLGDNRVLHVSGDARSPSTLRAAGVPRASVLYACEADSSANTAIALAAHSLPRSGPRHPLSAYAHISDPDLCAALRARRLSLAGRPPLRLDFFNLDELAARVLLERHPIVNDRPIVVLGLDAFGRSLLTEIARRRRLQPARPRRLPVTVIDTDARQAVASLCRRFEFITEACAVTTHDVAPDDLPLTDLLPGETPQRVFVCYADQDVALKVALTSLRLWGCGPGSLVVRVDQAATFSSAFDDVRLLESLSGALRIFAINEEAGDPRLITEDIVETLARAIHDNYLIVNATRNTTESVNTSMVPWELLPPRLKAANRAQAEDIGRKLASIGCALAPRVEPDLAFAFKDHEIESLSQMEHERWLKDLIKNGWTWGPLKDPIAMHHPDLDSWDRISPEAKEKDRDTVRSLPGILSSAGFQIVRIS